MPHNDSTTALLAPVVRAFVDNHRIPRDALRPDGRLVLTIDERWRVHLLPAPHQRVALQSDLLALPEQPERHTDDLLARLGRMAAGLLQRHASTLCIDVQRNCLLLQQSVPASCELAALEDALADFCNALTFWSRQCRSDPNAPQGGLT